MLLYETFLETIQLDALESQYAGKVAHIMLHSSFGCNLVFLRF